MRIVRTVLGAIVVSTFLGCAVNENINWAVTDPDMYWVRSGFSIKPPSGSYWTKLPNDEKAPNSIQFFKGEGIYNRGSTSTTYVYLKGTAALAQGAYLGSPLRERTDKQQLAATLLDILSRSLSVKIDDSGYEALSGSDCLRYAGTLKSERPRIERSDLNVERIKGYFCLHPQNDRFWVLMESRNFTTTSGDVSNRDEEIDHFFRSLIFTPLPAAVPAHPGPVPSKVAGGRDSETFL